MMFTEGLDSNALNWVREAGGAKKKENCEFMSAQKLKSATVVSLRNGRRGFGLPPPSKFGRGYLSAGVLPVSRPIPESGNDDGSRSDMDLSSDSEDEVYGGKYSVQSSPQDDKIPNVVGTKYASPMLSQANYGNGQVHSEFETTWLEHGNGDKLGEGGEGYKVGHHGCSEEESSDSATSTEFSYAQVRSKNSDVPSRGTYTSDCCSSNVTLQTNMEKATKQDFHDRGMENNWKLPKNDIPTAPPFASSGPEIIQIIEEISSVRDHGRSFPRNSNDSTSRTESVSQDITGSGIPDPSARFPDDVEVNASTGSFPACLPTFHASVQSPWCAVISYDACVRLCLHAWAKGFMEAPFFLNNECEVLQNAFGLQQVLLQSEEELLAKRSSKLVSEGAAAKPKRTLGKMKVEVRKVKMGLDVPTGCSFSSIKPPNMKLELLRLRVSDLKSTLYSGWESVRKIRVAPRMPSNGSCSRQSLAYVHANTRYIKQLSRLLKAGMATSFSGSSSYEAVQETYSFLLRLKSSSEDDIIRMQPGSGETHVFLPDSVGDDLIIEVQDSKGQHYGRVLAQVAALTDKVDNKLQWWPIYREPEHELVGRIQIYINYSTSPDNNHLKCGPVAETVAYDLVLEVAMQVQHFQQRNLLLHGQWKWLVTKFASYFGVSDAYTKLRYLTYIMDVATPTEDCLVLVHDLLLPVLMKGNNKSALSHQENRILGEIEEQVQQILALVFENYKSLDESSPSGMMDVFGPATGLAAPALVPAVKLYKLLHDMLSSEAQLKLCRHFQVAAKKRSKRLLAETDEFVSSTSEGTWMDPVILSTYYRKMKELILSIKNEIFTDMEIQNQHVLPSFLDLQNLSSSIYSVQLCNRLRAFLAACPPPGPSPPVAELVIAAADFQRDLISWNINSFKDGVDAKQLFHPYIIIWIEDKRLALLESCKVDKVQWSGVRTPHLTTPFVDDVYDQMKETLNEYETIFCRWPEYASVLEIAIADVEKAVFEAMDKQYADVLSPLKDNLTTKSLKYVQKFAKRTVDTYTIPDELGILLNSIRRMLDFFRPKIESQLESWGSCIPDGGDFVPGESLRDNTRILRNKYRDYFKAVSKKLAENTREQSATRLEKIIQDSKEPVTESDVRSRMQPLKDLLVKTINRLNAVFKPRVFIDICRDFWDWMGQDILKVTKKCGENRPWYKGSRFAVCILDDIFASQMQQLLGNSLHEKVLEPPASIMDVRSSLLLC